MTATAPHDRPAPSSRVAGRSASRSSRILTTTDHKVIGKLYLVTSFAWFLVGGVMALLMRAELAYPGQQFVNDELYNQLFTMHGTIMLLLFATPLFFGFANVIMPLQIGAPDVAFPRLNMFSYWLFLFGGLIAASGFLTPHGRGRLRLVRLRAARPTPSARPGVGGDLWIMGLWMAGLGTILGARQLHHHDHLHARARHDDVPDADLHLEHPGHQPAGADRVPGPRRRAARRSRPTGSSGPTSSTPPTAAPILWQHLFWFFGHPEVYIIALPFFGIVTEILPVFSRKPIFGYIGLVGATLAHRDPVGRRVGAPHVRHRRGRPAVLLRHDVPDRGAHRGEVLQLDRHDVGRIAVLRHPDAVGDRLPDHVPVRRPDRRHPGHARRWTSTSPTPTSWSRTSTTWCSAPSCSRCSPASTSGGRR